MADTPAPEKPKRSRAAKPADGEAKPAAARKPRKAVAASAPAAKKAAPAKAVATRKPAAKAASGEAKPKRAPRGAAAPKTQAPKTETPAASRPTPAASQARSAPQAPAGVLAALGTLAAVGGAFFIWRASRAEEPRYQTVESDNTIEVRKYPAMVTAGTETRGERQAALNEGFRTLADYLFAKSRPGARLPMTAPVLADTDGDGSWRTRFVMPDGKARAALPAAPAGVELVSEPARRVAAIRFTGRADDATLDAKEGALRSWLQIRGLPHEGKAVHAFYNAPFLPGPFRRNEVLIVLSEEGGMGG